jgi:hypothetical protein
MDTDILVPHSKFSLSGCDPSVAIETSPYVPGEQPD